MSGLLFSLCRKNCSKKVQIKFNLSSMLGINNMHIFLLLKMFSIMLDILKTENCINAILNLFIRVFEEVIFL